MGLAVGAHQSGTVHPQHHMEALEGDVVDQHIIAPLQEAGVHRKDRQHPLTGKARRHGGAMALRDAHIEEAVRVGPGEVAEARAVRHGGGDGADPGVLGRTVLQLAAEDGGKALSRGGHHAGLRVEGTHAVVAARVPLGIGAALALHRPDVDQDRALELPGPL